MSNGLISGDLLEIFAAGVKQARREAFAAGLPIVSRDEQGRYVQEWPDGRIFEMRFRPGAPEESHVEVIRELSRTAA